MEMIVFLLLIHVEIPGLAGTAPFLGVGFWIVEKLGK